MLTTKNAMIFKVLLNYFQASTNPKLLKKFNSEEAKVINAQKTAIVEPDLFFKWPKELIMRTHYSWLARVIQTVPEYLQQAMVNAFPEPVAHKLKLFLKFPEFPGDLGEPLKEFLLKIFFQYWHPMETLPIAYFPETNLSPLLKLSKDSLIKLISYLALQDVANLIRLTVDKTTLKNVYACLDQKQREYMRICLHYKVKLNFPKLNLSNWNGKPEVFENILQYFGMLRMAKALSGHSESFLWMITHALDTGRGSMIEKNYETQKIPGISDHLAQQIIFLLNFLNLKT